MNKKIAFTILIGVFSGMAIGYFGASILHQKHINNMRNRHGIEHVKNRVQKRLHLNLQQKTILDSLLDVHGAGIEAMHRQHRQEFSARYTLLFQDLEPHLNTKQKEKLNAMQRKIDRRSTRRTRSSE